MRIQLAALAGVMSVVLLTPIAAQGSTRVQYGVQDDAWLLYGPEAPAKRIEILQRLGVDMVRLTLRWDVVAQSIPTDARNPSDPAYDWDLYDPILQRLHAAHIGVLISLWGTPPWANEGQRPNFMPGRNNIACFVRVRQPRASIRGSRAGRSGMNRTRGSS